MRRTQEPATQPVASLACLGPRGTYSEEAAARFAPEARLVMCAGIPQAFARVEDGEADAAIVPIENSLEGAVTHTVDLLIHGGALRIAGELALPIRHCIATARSTRLDEVRTVHSHPQALAQCRAYLSTRLPRAELVASLSTAAAVRAAVESGEAAVSSERAARLGGAVIVERGIEDARTNETRFVALARADSPRTGDDRTSICFDFDEDEAGSLHGALGELAFRRINMIKIESRPDRRSLGRYIFLVDVEGHRSDPDVSAALEGIRRRASKFSILGSYPRWRG